MKTVVLLGFLAVALVAVACATGQRGRATTSAATPTATAAAPSTTPVNALDATRQEIDASPILNTSSGWLVYLRGPDLYVVDLATGRGDRLTDGSQGAGYAGNAVIDGQTWLYYLSIIDSPAGHPWTAVMRRRRLNSDADEQLFTFHPSSSLTWARDIASISPDGTRVAYAANDGLYVRTLASADDRLLLENHPMPADRSAAGFHYGRPVWSPTGRWLLVSREPDPPANAPNEGPLIIDPSDAASERDLPIRGPPVWSSDGLQLCGSTRATVSDLALYTVASEQVHNLTSSWFANASLDHGFGQCAWSSDGKLASGYDVGALQYEIAVLDTAGTRIAILDAGAVWPDVAQWLPDGTGVIVNTLGDLHLDPTSSAVMLDGAWRRLPTNGGYVVGTIPARP